MKTARQDDRLSQDIKKSILLNAQDLGLGCTQLINSIRLTKGNNELEIYYKKRDKGGQGMYSLNGSAKHTFYNLRVCILNQLGININHVG